MYAAEKQLSESLSCARQCTDIILLLLYETICHHKTRTGLNRSNASPVKYIICAFTCCEIIGIASDWRERSLKSWQQLGDNVIRYFCSSLSFKYRKQLSTICLNALRDKKQKFQLDAREHNKVWRMTSPLRQWRLPKSTWTQRNTRL